MPRQPLQQPGRPTARSRPIKLLYGGQTIGRPEIDDNATASRRRRPRPPDTSPLLVSAAAAAAARMMAFGGRCSSSSSSAGVERSAKFDPTEISPVGLKRNDRFLRQETTATDLSGASRSTRRTHQQNGNDVTVTSQQAV